VFKNNRLIWLVILGLGLAVICLRSPIITTLTGAKPAEAVISLGEDLTPVQKDRVMEYFKDWTKGKTLHYISVSNEEERKYLEGVVDENLIGSLNGNLPYLYPSSCTLFRVSGDILEYR
jgi:uncharacterized protein YpuA (DUF1002 family)